MIRVKHYTDTNSVEATWIDEDGRRTRCHSYDQYQMDMLRADLGAEASEYEGLISTVLANQLPPQTVPAPKVSDISLAQARAQLIIMGLLESIMTYIYAIPDETEKALALNDFEHRNDVLREHAMVSALQDMLGWTDAQVDDFFTAASQR